MERDQKLYRKSTNQAHGHTLEVVAFDKFVKVHAQNLENKDQMLSKDEFLFDLNYILFIVGIVSTQEFEDFGLDQALFI